MIMMMMVIRLGIHRNTVIFFLIILKLKYDVKRSENAHTHENDFKHLERTSFLFLFFIFNFQFGKQFRGHQQSI